MTFVYVGPTVLYDLGQIGELELLEYFDGALVVPERAQSEITAEPARTNLERFCAEASLITAVRDDALDAVEAALGVDRDHYEAALLAGVFDETAADDDVVVLSDDRRIRRLAAGLGAAVVGSFGVVVRAAITDKYLSARQAKRIVSRMDQHGVQLTGSLRARAIGEFVDG